MSTDSFTDFKLYLYCQTDMKYKHTYRAFKDTALQNILARNEIKENGNRQFIYVGQPLFGVTVINGKASWHHDCSKYVISHVQTE